MMRKEDRLANDTSELIQALAASVAVHRASACPMSSPAAQIR